MGKKIIVKGADFSANKITYTDISSTAVISRNGTTMINYPGNNQSNIVSYSTNATNQKRNFIAIDVSTYQGKYIRFTFASAVNSEDYVGGAYNACFASNLNVAIPFTGTSQVINAFTNVGNVPSKTHTFTYIAKIPDNAVYLLVQNVRTTVENPKFEILI